MADDDEVGFGLTLAFDSDDPLFARGFNAGALYGWLAAVQHRLRETGMRSGATLVPPFYCLPENAEMIIRIGEALDLQPRIKSEVGDQLEVTFHMKSRPLQGPS